MEEDHVQKDTLQVVASPDVAEWLEYMKNGIFDVEGGGLGKDFSFLAYSTSPATDTRISLRIEVCHSTLSQ